MSQKRMWTKYELKTIRDPRLTKLPRSQRLMYFEALAHANEYGTDGLIEYSDLRLFTDASKPAMIAQAFVAAGLWSDVSQNDGHKSVRCQSKRWRIVDFLDEQLSAEEVQTRAKNSAVTTERNRRHKAGDHSKCDPKRCWALQNVTRHDPGHVTTDVTDDVTLHDTKRHETKRSESGVRSEVDKKPPASPPSAGAPGATPPAKETPSTPVADDEPLRPRTPLAEIDLENFDLHDVTARTEVSLYEVDDDGGCEVYAVLHRTEELLSCDPNAPLYAQILAKVSERLAWIGEAIESKLTAAGCRFDAVTCFAEDPMDDWTITVEWCRVEDRAKLAEIAEEALQDAGLFPVAIE